MADYMTVSPKISPQSKSFYEKHFPSTNAGVTYVLDAFPAIWERTAYEAKRAFTRGEMRFIKKAFESCESLSPSSAGQLIISLCTHLAESSDEAEGMGVKWETLVAKLLAMPRSSLMMMEIWLYGLSRAKKRVAGRKKKNKKK
jgi:hypothetical protein